jgi:hypothetical protein
MTFRNWCRDHEEFREAFEAARLLLETYWTRELARNRNNPNARPGLYTLIVRLFTHYYGHINADADASFRWFPGRSSRQIDPGWAV